MAFVDRERAFDRVVGAGLWECLTGRGVFGELLRAIQSLCVCSRAAVGAGGGSGLVRGEMWIKTRMCVVAFVIRNICG